MCIAEGQASVTAPELEDSQAVDRRELRQCSSLDAFRIDAPGHAESMTAYEVSDDACATIAMHYSSNR